jgi:glycosyltransferase involved in cell wall biosynthesis
MLEGNMKILITTGIFKPELGGPATYAAEMGKRLGALGHTVAVITYSDRKTFDLDKEYDFPITRIVRSNKLFNYLKFFLAILRYAPKYDFIYSLDWFSVGVPQLFASFLVRKKYIMRVGGDYIWEKYLRDNKPPLTLKDFYLKERYADYSVMHFLIKRVLKNAFFVIFNSDDERELYYEFYGLTPERTATIFNPVPENRLGTLVQSFKKENGGRDREIVFAGRFIKMKNVESAIQAFARLTDTSFRLLLIGEGPSEHELRKLVAHLGIADRVEFLPAMTQADLYRRNCELLFSYFAELDRCFAESGV